MPGASPAGACHPHPQWTCFPWVVLAATSQTGPNLLTLDISASEQSFLAQGSRIKGCGGGKAGSRSSGGRSRPDSEGGGMHSIQAGPPGPHVWGSGPPREGDRGTGLFVYKPSPSSPRFCFPFKPWRGFSTVEVLGGELACWDPSMHRSFPWPAPLLEAGPAGAGVGDRGQTPSPSSRPTDPRALRTVAWEPQGRVVSRHHCAQT